MASVSVLLSLIIIITYLISSAKSLSNNGGVTIDLIHRDFSPLSPFYDPSKTRFERLRNSIDRSFSRKSSLLSTSAPLTSGGGEYLIEYKIGTPPVRQLSIADTGSDLTWIQCLPCISCYKQDYSLFDPSTTKSYKPVRCKTDQCAHGGPTSCGDNDVCQYEIGYGSGFSKGGLAMDTLTLGSSLSLPNFVFGCGNNNNLTFKSPGSGIFGLGNGVVSIINQQANFVGGRFSYCLAPLNSNVSSKISFGNEAVVTGPKVVSTPLLSKDKGTHYYLTLEGFSVGRQRFEYKSSKINQVSEKGNIFIDSGTMLSFIPPELLDGIETMLKNAIKGSPVSSPQGPFNLCYHSKDGEFSSPPVTAHFEGADVVILQSSIFIEVKEGIFCLTLVPDDFGLSIFGNLHQAGYLIGYDLIKKQLNFLKTDCR